MREKGGDNYRLLFFVSRDLENCQRGGLGLLLWDVTGRGKPRTLRGGVGSEWVALSRDGRIAISADSGLTVWDVKKGRKINTLSGHRWYVVDAALNEDGNAGGFGFVGQDAEGLDTKTGRESDLCAVTRRSTWRGLE